MHFALYVWLCVFAGNGSAARVSRVLHLYEVLCVFCIVCLCQKNVV